ncbi:hypothetical protein HaLaN_00301 [Haematococcus lacustris]|uniref:Uncharacterized protein n=1 Tax=Haematococcus lacustris TaxID=44745 RepID=A0A699Y6C7_HAELA|nr:hypothetical protein HaLaN_00301 [Haematococcus lacustris]
MTSRPPHAALLTLEGMAANVGNAHFVARQQTVFAEESPLQCQAPEGLKSREGRSYFRSSPAGDQHWCCPSPDVGVVIVARRHPRRCGIPAHTAFSSSLPSAGPGTTPLHPSSAALDLQVKANQAPVTEAAPALPPSPAVGSAAGVGPTHTSPPPSPAPTPGLAQAEAPGNEAVAAAAAAVGAAVQAEAARLDIPANTASAAAAAAGAVVSQCLTAQGQPATTPANTPATTPATVPAATPATNPTTESSLHSPTGMALILSAQLTAPAAAVAAGLSSSAVAAGGSPGEGVCVGVREGSPAQPPRGSSAAQHDGHQLLQPGPESRLAYYAAAGALVPGSSGPADSADVTCSHSPSPARSHLQSEASQGHLLPRQAARQGSLGLEGAGHTGGPEGAEQQGEGEAAADHQLPDRADAGPGGGSGEHSANSQAGGRGAGCSSKGGVAERVRMGSGGERGGQEGRQEGSSPGGHKRSASGVEAGQLGDLGLLPGALGEDMGDDWLSEPPTVAVRRVRRRLVHMEAGAGVGAVGEVGEVKEVGPRAQAGLGLGLEAAMAGPAGSAYQHGRAQQQQRQLEQLRQMEQLAGMAAQLPFSTPQARPSLLGMRSPAGRSGKLGGSWPGKAALVSPGGKLACGHGRALWARGRPAGYQQSSRVPAMQCHGMTSLCLAHLAPEGAKGKRTAACLLTSAHTELASVFVASSCQGCAVQTGPALPGDALAHPPPPTHYSAR